MGCYGQARLPKQLPQLASREISKASTSHCDSVGFWYTVKPTVTVPADQLSNALMSDKSLLLLIRSTLPEAA